MKLNSFLVVILILSSLEITHARIRPLEFKFSDVLVAPRWQYGEASIESIGMPTRDLAYIKLFYENKKYGSCLQQIDKAKGRLQSLVPWLTVAALKCAKEGVENDKIPLKKLTYWVQYSLKNRSWWTYGGHKGDLQAITMESLLILFEMSISKNRGQAWSYFDQLIELKSYLSDKQLAAVLRHAGELAFVQQNLIAAYDFLNRSISLQGNRDIKIRLKSIRDLLVEKKLLPQKQKNQKQRVNIELEASEQENKLNEQMRVALSAGDLVPAVQDGMKLVSQFPSGVRTQSAEKQILQIYINIVGKSSNKYKSVLGRIFNEMKKASGDTLLRWAKYLFAKSYHNEAASFFKVAVEKLESDDVIAELYSLLGASQIYTENYEDAKTAFAKCVTLGAGTEFAETCFFRLGLTHFRLGEMSASAAQFERLLASRENSSFEVSARYWLWRSLQSLDKEQAINQAKELYSRFPLTYYGLRARFEVEGKSLDWLKGEAKEVPDLTLNVTDSEYLSWEISKILMAAGWFEEAHQELANLPQVYLSSSKLILAKIWSYAFNHFESITLLNEVWDLDSDYRNLETVNLAFPREFKKIVEKVAGDYELEQELIWGIIRQESSFRIDALSPAGAAGPMQLMPATAKDVARRMRLSSFDVTKDIFIPETNIRLGGYYISQMLRAFDGHLPMAVAAYNVGIGNMRKWTRLRPSVEKQTLTRTSNFRNEIWIDELPWEETREYVKAILRNLILYKALAKGEMILNEPIW